MWLQTCETKGKTLKINIVPLSIFETVRRFNITPTDAGFRSNESYNFRKAPLFLVRREVLTLDVGETVRRFNITPTDAGFHTTDLYLCALSDRSLISSYICSIRVFSHNRLSGIQPVIPASAYLSLFHSFFEM